MTTGSVVTLTPTRPDTEVAEEAKRKMADALIGVCAVMDEAKAQGLDIQFNVGMGPFKKFVVTQLQVLRIY